MQEVKEEYEMNGEGEERGKEVIVRKPWTGKLLGK